MKKLINKLNQRLRSSLSIMVLSLCTVFLFFSNSAIAQTFSGGDGSQTTPYLISTPADLVKLANYVNGTNGYTQNGFSGKYFQMTTNIDMSSIPNFTPIGIGTTSVISFQGIFDGNNKKVLNLKEDGTGTVGGLFGMIYKNGTNDAIVKNLGIISANIRLVKTGTDVGTIGAIAGGVNGGNIINCYVRNSQVKANCKISGGLVGTILSGTHIYNCYTTGTTVELQGNNLYVGGLIGWCYAGSNIIQNCYSTSVLSSTTSNNTITNIGGIYGFCMTAGTFNNCYYRTDWKGTNLTGTPTENSNFTTNSSTIYSKAIADMKLSSFVSSTGGAGTTLNLASTVVSGATTYQTDFHLNDGYPIFTSDGTQLDPFLISTPDDLVKLSNYVNGANGYTQNSFSGKYFQMTNDIDMSSIPNFTPIGTSSNSFKGVFDGNNKEIKNLKISSDIQSVGLFSNILNATIKNIGIVNATITSTKDISNYAYSVGGLAGTVSRSIVSNCYIRNSTITTIGDISCGGLIGVDGRGTYNNCYTANCTINTRQGNGSYVGGFIGITMVHASYFNNCYAASKINITNTPTNTSRFYGGGFFGNSMNSTAYGGKATYTNCYYLDTWKGIGVATTQVTENNVDANITGNVYSKTAVEMRATNFVNVSTATADAGTTLNYGTPITGVTIYKQDYMFGANHGFPLFTTETKVVVSPYTIASGEEFVVPSGTATTEIPSAIIIKDGGSLINNSTNDITTKTTVETNMKVGAWNLFGRVLNSGDISILNNNQGSGYTTNHQHDMAAVQYDYTSNLWNTTYLGINYVSTCNLGEGYFVYPYVGAVGSNQTTLNDNYTVVSQQGTSTTPLFNELSKSVTVNISATASDFNSAKWVALSNPYYGKIKISDFLNTTNSANINGGVVYIYDPDANAWKTNITGINTYTWNGSSYTQSQTTPPITTIKPTQGFMVAANGTGNKIYTITKPTTASSKAITTHNSLITFAAIANNTVKEVFANVNEQASNGFDNNDAYVMLSTNNTELVEPYFLIEDRQILKDEFKTLPYIVPINFHASKTSNVDLTVSNIPNEVKVFIVDLASGNEIELTNGSAFSFVANQGENEGRFVVKFAKNNVSIDNNAEENNISLAMYPNPATTQTTLFVDGLTNNAQVNICDVQGRTINTYTINKNQSTLKINTENLSSGVYYIRVVSNNLTKTEKLVVK